MTRLRHAGRSAYATTATGAIGSLPRIRAVDRASAIRALTMGEPTVYAVQLPDGTIKIGCSEHLDKRRRCIDPDAEVLGFMPGDFDDEAAIHAQLVEYRDHGREYYRPTSAVLAVVNRMRQRFNLPPIE
ncbi:hypothetical protein ABKW28_12870 [Nocardioides sp. 31GB23]|uniref:hypothetical protein n=1 Tax=Nocardioides sp. 31GB23 TaxID=3156065 RepID=UPI0032B00170